MFQVDITHAAVVITGLIVWLAGLQFDRNRMKKDIDKLEVKQDNHEGNVLKKLSILEQSLARIEGKLSK